MAGFGDERLKAFANRLTTQADVPWLTLPKARAEIALLRQTLPAGDATRHEHLDAIERWLSEQNWFFQLAA